MEKYSKNSKKQACVVIVIYDKVDFKPKLMRRNREGCYLLIKGKIHQEDITILNIYAPKQGTQVHKRIITTAYIRILTLTH